MSTASSCPSKSREIQPAGSTHIPHQPIPPAVGCGPVRFSVPRSTILFENISRGIVYRSQRGEWSNTAQELNEKIMGLTAMLVGSISGTGMQMMNNALQKVPLSRSKFFRNIMCLLNCSGENRTVQMRRWLLLI